MVSTSRVADILVFVIEHDHKTKYVHGVLDPPVPEFTTIQSNYACPQIGYPEGGGWQQQWIQESEIPWTLSLLAGSLEIWPNFCIAQFQHRGEGDGPEAMGEESCTSRDSPEKEWCYVKRTGDTKKCSRNGNFRCTRQFTQNGRQRTKKNKAEIIRSNR